MHISARPPFGYRRGSEGTEKGRLFRDDPAAGAVAELFRRRVLGASWADLARYLDEQQLKPPTGNPHWSKVGVSNLVKNPVYLGQARSGAATKEGAHEPLVTRAEWDAAQSVTKSLLPTRDGSVASQALLGGLVRCAGCGHTLKITGNTDKRTGERYPVYYCVGRYASGLCSARATARASGVDSYVEQRVLEALRHENGLLAEAVAASAQLEAAAREVEEAEHELDLFVNNPKLLNLLGETKFVEGVQVRQAALDQTRRDLGQLRTQSNLAEELGDGDLLNAWPNLAVTDRRRLLHGLLERVLLTRANGRGRHAEPIGDRTQIILRGGRLVETTR